jgi:ER membrane protein complex subunit 8/9
VAKRQNSQDLFAVLAHHHVVTEPQLVMPAITFSSQAYVKVYFHAAKHPHQTINGVLVGKQSGDGAIDVQDAIPLLHHWTNLSPMMEIGLDLVRGLQAAGVYYALTCV